MDFHCLYTRSLLCVGNASSQKVTFFGLLRSAKECRICNNTAMATNTTSDDDGDNSDDSSNHMKTPSHKKCFLRGKTDGTSDDLMFL